MELEDIFKENEVNLVDTNVFPSNGLIPHLYDCNLFEGVDYNLLCDFNEKISHTRDLFRNNENVYFIPEVTEELTSLRNILNTSIGFFEYMHGNKYIESNGHLDSELLEPNRDKLYEMTRKLHRVIRVSGKRNIFKNFSEDEEKFYEVCLEYLKNELAFFPGLKIDNSPYSYKKDGFDLGTDEKLLAAAFALAHSRSDQNVSIISSDSDIVRLRDHVYSLSKGDSPSVRIYSYFNETGNYGERFYDGDLVGEVVSF